MGWKYLRRSAILGVLLVAQIAIVLVVGKRGGHASYGPSPLPRWKASEITKLAITKDGKTVALVRMPKPEAVVPETPAKDDDKKKNERPDPWRLVSPDSPADGHAVKSLVDALERATFGEKVSSKPEWHGEKFGVDEKGATKIEVTTEDGKKNAAFFVGKETGGRAFARLVDSNDVYSMSGLPSYAFNKQAKDWRDKTILSFRDKRDDLAALKVVHASGETIHLTRKEPSSWEMAEPKLPNYKLDAKIVDGVVEALVSYNAIDFADDAKAEQTGLTKALLSVTLEWKPGSKAEKPVTLLIGAKQEKENRYFAQVLGEKQVYFVGDYQVTQIKKTVEELREKEPVIPKFKPDEAVALAIRGKSGSAEFLKEADGTWVMTTPTRARVDADRMRALIEKVSRENVAFNERGGREKHSEFEVDGRGLFVQVTTKEKRLQAFVLGRAEAGATYIRREDDEKVYQTYALKRDDFPVDLKAWRDKVVTSFSVGDATSFGVARGGDEIAVEKRDGKWVFTKGAPIGTAVREQKVVTALTTLSHLKANAFAAAGDVTGLEKPVATVTLKVKGESITLRLGAKKPPGDQYLSRVGVDAAYVVRAYHVASFDLKASDLGEVAPAPTPVPPQPPAPPRAPAPVAPRGADAGAPARAR